MKSNEEKWMNRLKRVIDDMPKGYRLFVRHGYCELVSETEKRDVFEANGSHDKCEATESIQTPRVEPHGEGM